MAEGFTEKASLWDCGLAWGSLEKSVNPRRSRSLTDLTGLPATYEQEAGASVLEITSLLSIKACWQARGREKLFSSPILFSYIKIILEIYFSGSLKLCFFLVSSQYKIPVHLPRLWIRPFHRALSILKSLQQ